MLEKIEESGTLAKRWDAWRKVRGIEWRGLGVEGQIVCNVQTYRVA